MNSLLNHVLIHTSDLKKMSLFFEQILGLKQGYRPPFPFSGAWLYSDDKPIIHLSESNPADTEFSDYLDAKSTSKPGTGIIDHIAFSGNDYPLLIKQLEHYHLNFFERSVPLTGEHQVFVTAPEGLKVEIQFDSEMIES